MMSGHIYGQKKSAKQPYPAKNNTISSIKYNGDSISINQMIIVKNKNLQAFITDLKKVKLASSSSLNYIPWFVKSFLESFGNTHFTMAKPDQDWNCCCVQNDQLPNRQMICQGKGQNLYFISYLTGGFGEIVHLVLIRYHNETITDFWTGTINRRLNNQNAIIEYLQNNKNEHYSLGI